MQLICGGKIESTKLLGMLNIPCKGLKKTPTKFEAHAGIEERLMRELEIEEALQIKVKLQQNKKINLMYNGGLYQMIKEIKTR